MGDKSFPQNRVAILGIDIGGTKTLCVLVDKQCRILREVKFKTAPGEGRGEFTRTLLEAATSLKETADLKNLKVIGIGVACAGSVDPKAGLISKSPNLLC